MLLMQLDGFLVNSLVKSLRGSSMSDVIFAGSEDRRAQNLAEVTLVFDNTDRYMKYDYNEVEITRRLIVKIMKQNI